MIAVVLGLTMGIGVIVALGGFSLLSLGRSSGTVIAVVATRTAESVVESAPPSSTPMDKSSSTEVPPMVTSTPTATFTPIIVTTMMPTATSPAPSPPTSTPTLTDVVLPAACPDALARITSPGVNQTVRGAVEVKGTADIDLFQFYKVEFSLGHDASEFHLIEAVKYSPVNDGALIVWNTAGLSGPVTLRLTVVNIDGNYATPCDVPVIVQSE